MTDRELLKNIVIRRIHADEPIPYRLLLDADPSREAVSGVMGRDYSSFCKNVVCRLEFSFCNSQNFAVALILNQSKDFPVLRIKTFWQIN